MSTTLTYGRKRPDDGDRGSTFFDDLENNITLDDAHDHDGTDSPLLPTSSFINTTQAIASGPWAAVSGKPGLYKQTVTLPGTLTYDGRGIFFKDSTSGHIYNLKVEKVSATTYDVFINDNTVSLTAIYV